MGSSGAARGRRPRTEIGATRRDARERALSLLYEAEAKHQEVDRVLGDLPVAPDAYAVAVVTGVASHRERVDALVSGAAVGWDLDRMPVVDRTVLRMATWELLERPDVPTAVVIDEAVELAKRFSTDQSGSFVNGVLATIARQVRGEEQRPAGPDGGGQEQPPGREGGHGTDTGTGPAARG